MTPLAYYLVFYLYLHACTARLLIVSDEESAARPKFSGKDDISSERGLNILQLSDQKLVSIQEAENNEGQTTEGLHSSTVFHEATGTEISKRLMLASELEENVSSSKNEETVEDIVVMDYAQPHRKPPIHNKGT